MQSSWWPDVMFVRGWSQFGVVVRDGDAIAGGARVMYGEGPGTIWYFIPEGPVLPQNEEDAAQVFRAVMDSIGEKRASEDRVVSHLCIEPRWEKMPDFAAEFRPRRGWLEPRNTVYVDLSVDEDALLARMKPKGRYNIRLAQRHGVSVVEDISSRGLADWLRLYQATVDRHDLKPKPTEYFDALVAKFNANECGSIHFAEYRGERIAAAMVVYFGKRATYFFGGSLDAHRNVMAPYLLHFEVMRQAKARGCDWYDLYAVAPADAGADHKWAGFSELKRKLGGVEVRFVPSLNFIYDQSAYYATRK
jgi:lipid II:glycine glycyltransferase (peptidoglycan interpeptide bridge formation enzyme)